VEKGLTLEEIFHSIKFKAMSILELRGEITTMISQMDDKKLLLLLRNQVAKALRGELGQAASDWWYELTPEQQADLDLALEEIKDPANLVSHDEALKFLEKWRIRN
jgi:hypothetical protein